MTTNSVCSRIFRKLPNQDEAGTAHNDLSASRSAKYCNIACRSTCPLNPPPPSHITEQKNPKMLESGKLSKSGDSPYLFPSEGISPQSVSSDFPKIPFPLKHSPRGKRGEVWLIKWSKTFQKNEIKTQFFNTFPPCILNLLQGTYRVVARMQFHCDHVELILNLSFAR